MADKAPKIEFPCDYQIKVIGDATDDFHERVVTVVRRHAPDLDESRIEVQDSAKGRFMSLRIWIRATGVDQLQALFGELKQDTGIHMVL
ncbi:DUF493 domain-containing protein [Hahella sp. SMD15-11]|uniref:UPF0250 protein AAIA72_16570 n=1 Tax=Thermohahella caldifontis TaxID=3142973 RepID=A0AB39UW19_9GAMM